MRHRIGRHLFAAALGVLALAAAAAAQDSRPAKGFAMALPGQAPVVAPSGVVPAGCAGCDAAAAIPPAAAPAGCSSCGSAAGGHALKARVFGPDGGCSNPVTCGNRCTERTFFFGSCGAFFGNGRDCSSCGGLFGRCPGMVYGPGAHAGMNPCTYDSYLNH